MCKSNLHVVHPLFLWGFLAAPEGMWDLSFTTRDRSTPPALEVHSLNHWTTREVPTPYTVTYVNYFSIKLEKIN